MTRPHPSPDSAAEEALHWADRTAREVAGRSAAPVVCTGISPSGQFHIGHLREILTGDAVVRALRDRGAPARLLFVVDNLDPLRKVYPFLDPARFTPLIGHSLCEIPAPEGPGSYGDYFLRPFLGVLEALRVDAEVVPADQLYASGRMDEVIFTALEGSEQLARLLTEITRAEEQRAGWSPWNPRCTSCRRLDKGEVLSWDRRAGTIRSRCAACGAISEQPARSGGKLTWRVDWPARWKALGVSAEPFGKDHASKGGSYDTGVAFCRAVLDYEPPIPLVYEWIALKGQGDMSSSKGNVLSAAELLTMVPPEVVRYLVMKSRPARAITFDPGLPLLRLVDEVDDASTSERDDRALELSRAAGFRPVGVPFKHLVLVAQIGLFDLERVLKILTHGGYRDLDREAIAQRVAMARVWAERFAPEDQRIRVLDELPEAVARLAPAQKAALQALADRIRGGGFETLPGDELQARVLEIGNSEPRGEPVGTKALFEAIYTALLGRNRGPRAGTFLELLIETFGSDWLATRFAAAARS